MGRARDIANVLSSSTNIALDSELGLSLITPTSIAVTGGSATISSTGAVSFTSASAVNLNGVFTSSYKNYFLTWESTSPIVQYPNWRLSTGGTPSSTTDYQIQRFESSAANNQSQRTSATTVFSLTSNSATAFAATIYLFAPQVAEKTFVISHTIQNNEGTFTSPISMFSTGIFNATTQFDGIQLLPNTSTITGTVRVYGYRN